MWIVSASFVYLKGATRCLAWVYGNGTSAILPKSFKMFIYVLTSIKLMFLLD